MNEEQPTTKADRIKKLLELNAKGPITTDLYLWLGQDDDTEEDSSDESDVICIDSDSEHDRPNTNSIHQSDFVLSNTLSESSKADKLICDQFNYDSDESVFESSYITQSKWCICEQDNLSTKYSKICEKCNQWYHLNCLGLSEMVVTALIRNKNTEEFICPVCLNDKAFIENYRKKIEFRQQKHSTPHVLLTDEQDTQQEDSTNTESNDSDIENHTPKTSSTASSSVELSSNGHKPQQKIMKRMEDTKQAKAKPTTSKITISPVNTVSVTVPKIYKAPYTAKSSKNPIHRKNLQCIECHKYLKEKYHPVRIILMKQLS